METGGERRRRPRFPLSAPLTVILQGREIPACTRDMSENGIFFYLDVPSEGLIEGEFEFIVQFPPELTHSTSPAIRCLGRLARKDSNATGWNGIGAEILHYSFLKRAPSLG